MSRMHSLSTIERANPPPRRKSCQACIKAKRRCDLGQPACLRCTQRLLECRYSPVIPPARRAAATNADKRQAVVTVDDAVAHWPSALHDREQNFESVDEPDCRVLFDQQSMTEADLDAGMDFFDADLDMLQFINDTPATTVEMDDMQLFPPSFPIPTPSYKLDLILQPKQLSHSRGNQLLGTGKWGETPLPITLAHRLQYAVDLVKDAPRRMVLDLQTPWCHPELYREHMPRSMQDAIAACGLYLAKNARNSSVILHSIRSRIQDLVSAPPSNRPLEILARAQAFLLYITILVFDGDIHSRSAAEAATPAMESAAIGLVGLFGHNPFTPSSVPAPPESLPLYPIGPAREFWQRWVLEESARRTYLTTFFILQLYLLLKGEVPKKCDDRLYLCHFWTVSAHLWGAGDAFDFACAWRDRRHFVVNNSTIKDILSDANGDDIEDFGKMILTTLMGIDETKGWLHSKGASL